MKSPAFQVLQPPDWPRPKGYSNGIVARGRPVFLAGQIGWDTEGRFASQTLSGQVRTALQNVLAILATINAGPEHIVRLTWFVTSRDEYHQELQQIGAVYREVMGKHFPCMSVVQVVGLIEAQAKVEIEATAVIPEGD